jgi:NAD+ diphosphatase
MEKPNFYARLPVDRQSERRRDASFVSERLAAPTARLVVVWRTRNLVLPGESPAARFIEPDRLAHLDGPRIYLGDLEGTPYFALDVSALDETDLPRHVDAAASFVDLRSIGPALPREQGGLLAYARGLAWWHARHRHCGVCGAPTAPEAAGHVLKCTNAACGAEHFPRSDPATIMLIVSGDRCLLGRSARFPTAMYSTLAGFVEPGESLEDCVRRETFEESGVRVGAVRYHSSQPWPFPASIMLGFYGEALTTELAIDREELVDAMWVTRDFLRGPHDPEKFRLPRADSIARRLIEDWIDGSAGA